MVKERKLSFSTIGGSTRLTLIFVSLILVFSFIARFISSDGGYIKITRVIFDSRGAAINADLYYPSGVSDKDKLPAVLVAHGGGVNKGVVRGIAEEIARRGFVVMNVDAYGTGLSEEPVSDDGGQGAVKYSNMATPAGMIDALDYIRSLHFVDTTRIGMTGHSLGSRRTGYAAIMDCGYFTFNDIMINVLANTFKQTFTATEIFKNADSLAKERLTADQLAYYNSLKDGLSKTYNSKLKSICLIGSDANLVGVTQPVKVAGYSVLRNCAVNMGIVSGWYDLSYSNYPNRDTTKTYWHTGGANITPETWYVLDDVNNKSKTLGGIYDISVAKNAELKAAIDNRTARVCMYNQETHSKNFFSAETAADVVKYFEQTLSYNRGELTSASTTPLNATNIVYLWREFFNLMAMLAMIGFVASSASLILKSKFFKPCVAETASSQAPYNKKLYWLLGLVTVILTYIIMYIINTLTPFMFPTVSFLPLFGTFWMTFALVALLAAASVIVLVCISIIDKKKNGVTGLKALHLKMKLTSILKAVLLGVILLALAYLTLMMIEYLFNEDYRVWMAAFTEMKVEQWDYVWRFALPMLPFFLLIGAGTNYTIRKDIPEWRDTLVTVVINSLGVWLCCLANYALVYSGAIKGALYSSFISTYGMLIIVPITVYISRKMYKLTNSIWLGAIVNCLIVTWTMISAAGMDINAYYAQTALGNFFGA